MGCHRYFLALNFLVMLSAFSGSSWPWRRRERSADERDYFIHATNLRQEKVEATVATSRFHSEQMPMFRIPNNEELVWEFNFAPGDKVVGGFCWRGEDGQLRYKQFTLLNDALNIPKYRKVKENVRNYEYFEWSMGRDGLYLKSNVRGEPDFLYQLDGATILENCKDMVLNLELTNS